MDISVELDLNPKRIPAHVAIIMDGNRRWAAKRGLGPVAGHEQAARKAIEPVVDRAIELGIKFITFWAFSTENWRRDEEEVQGLMGIFRNVLKEKIAKLHKRGVRLAFLGDLDRFPQDVSRQVKDGVEQTKNNSTITVTFALNYGGRPEILQAVGRLFDKIRMGEMKIEDLTEESFGQFLDTGLQGIPDPDLIIRVGGEKRLSGFLPWQGVYSELYFTPTLWPDFDQTQFDEAIADYQRRDRRFGGGSFKDYTGQKSRRRETPQKEKDRVNTISAWVGLRR